MPFRRSRDEDICPLYDEKIRSSGDKYKSKPLPCMSSARFGEKGKCEYLSQSWTGRWKATVQCRFKPSTDSNGRRLEK